MTAIKAQNKTNIMMMFFGGMVHSIPLANIKKKFRIHQQDKLQKIPQLWLRT